jgi:hypothetical protein
MQSQKKHRIRHKAQKIKEKRYRHCHQPKNAYSMKLDLLTNATVIDDAIRFVSFSESKEKQKSFLGNSDAGDEELDEDAHHEKPREINDTPTTTNQVF